MGRLDGKVALVTGGARGIGGALVEGLVREGVRVMAADVLEARENGWSAVSTVPRRSYASM